MADLLRAIEQAVDAYFLVWEAPMDKLARLRPRVGAPGLDTVSADEVLALDVRR
jgi:hypothetical protein